MRSEGIGGADSHHRERKATGRAGTGDHKPRDGERTGRKGGRFGRTDGPSRSPTGRNRRKMRGLPRRGSVKALSGGWYDRAGDRDAQSADLNSQAVDRKRRTGGRNQKRRGHSEREGGQHEQHGGRCERTGDP